MNGLAPHTLRIFEAVAMLTNGARFLRDAHFEQLAPVYQVTVQDIEEYIKTCLF